MIGRADTDFFPPDQAAFFEENDRRALNDKKPVDIPREPIDTAGGRRWLHTKKIPVLDKEGVARFLLGISLDVTDCHEAEEALARKTSWSGASSNARPNCRSRWRASSEEISDREKAERALAEERRAAAPRAKDGGGRALGRLCGRTTSTTCFRSSWATPK